MGKRKGTPTTISRLHVSLGTLVGVRECISDALEFAERGIETIRKTIAEQAKAEAPIPISQAEESEAEILSITKQWRRNRRTWGWIAEELNRRGYRRPRGGLWSTADIRPFCTRRNKVSGKNGQSQKETGPASNA